VPSSQVEGTSTTGRPVAYRTDDSSGTPAWILIAGLAVASAAVWGGWMLYRRRLY
jgi:hypothetical protein